MTYVTMAQILMACRVMACTGTSYLAMANIVLAQITVVFIGMACTVTA